MTANDPIVMKLAIALAAILGSGKDDSTPMVATARYVTIRLAATKIGLTEKAIRRKIEDGKWLQGQEYVRAPDGHIMIDMDGVQSWVEKAAA